MVEIWYIFILLSIENRKIPDNIGNDVFLAYLDSRRSYETKPVARSLQISFFVGYSVIKGVNRNSCITGVASSC